MHRTAPGRAGPFDERRSVMIALIDYGISNLRSVQKAFEHLGAPVTLASEPDQVMRADKLILPGVGAFSAGMDGLRQRGLVEPIKQSVQAGVPLIGICLGMQLLFDGSEEVGQDQPPEPGLSLLGGRVVRLRGDGIHIPHMGWNQLEPVHDSALLRGIEPGAYAYFVHSYVCEPADPDAVLATTDYGQAFCSMVGRGNVWGIQFHPEKSQRTGLQVLRNFLMAATPTPGSFPVSPGKAGRVSSRVPAGEGQSRDYV
jgi:glutamine amidotransferase